MSGKRKELEACLLKQFMIDIQRARYESFIIDVASAYVGYDFYLPTFLDF